MKISIVIPTYNGARYIEEAILSVINQTCPADEIIISDDNSTDNTLDICEKYSDHIKMFTNPNGPSGFVNGWNNAIAKVKEGYISILHQDDTLQPTFIEEMRMAILQHPDVRHFFAPCQYIDSDSKVLITPNYCNNIIQRYTGIEYVRAYQTIGTPHIHRCPGVITHLSIFELCKYREEAGHIADDDFFYRVGQFTDVVGVLKPLASYRQHSDSETGHLSDVNLVKRLISDFAFQAKHASENTLFSKKDIVFMKSLKMRYIKRYVGYCIKRRDIISMSYILNYLIK